MIHTIKVVAAEDGPLALYNGLGAGLQRQVINAGLKIGMYVPIRDQVQSALGEQGLPSLKTKILAGILSGAIGITVANPADMVKVKL